MGDIKLFHTSGPEFNEIQGRSVEIERSIQSLIERNLEKLLGVRYLTSEHITGPAHGGRIDTLGIDENGCPVIVEYKRTLNENVINQGLYYIDWLLDHKGEFELLVLKRLGEKVSREIEWSSPRLLCIAGDFTKYDEHAVRQIGRNIELIRYRRFGEDLLLLELVNAPAGEEPRVASEPGKVKGSREKTISEILSQLGGGISDRFEKLKTFLLSLGDDVQMKTLKYYIAFKRLQNFACLEIHPQLGKITVYIKVNPDSVALESGFTRDVRNIGHYGTGDLEVSIDSDEDLERLKSLLLRSYENS